MKTLTQDKILLILAAASVVVFAVLLFLFFYSAKTGNNAPLPPGATPFPVPKDTAVNYSNFNELKPGNSTLSDVEKINGAPSRTSKDGDKTYLFYNTPVKGLENKILIRYGVVIYAFENVYADYRGRYDSYTKSFEPANITLYSANDFGYPWYVFLNKGVAVQSTNNYITGIIYFSPQNKTNFMTNVAGDFGLSEQEPQGNQ